MARKHRKNETIENQEPGVVIDFEEAREERRRKRAEAASKKEKKKPEKKPLSARRKKQSARAARRRFLLVALAVVIVLLAAFSAHNIFELREDQREAQQMLKDLEEERDRLQDELNHVSSPEYVEQKAREDLHMIYPDEYLYIVPEDDAGKPAEDAQ
ncbi:MAG: septum formation initiator family protein [Clostridiales bacterium]|nr:septum formation initiator family protein [Clostridiales bacterium]